MASAALLINNLGPERAKCSALLMKTFQVGLPAIQAAMATGTPVAVREMFGRHHPDFGRELLVLLEALSKLGCEWSAYQILQGQSFEPTGKYWEITIDRLRNLIESNARISHEARLMNEREAGDD